MSERVDSRTTGDLGLELNAPHLWTVDQVAYYLGVPKKTIYCWRTSGYGPQGFRVGKYLRWRAETVVEWTRQLESLP